MRKVKFFVIFCMILFPFIKVTGKSITINKSYQIDSSVLLSDLSLVNIERIAQIIAYAYINKQFIREFDYNFTSEEAQIIQEKLINILKSSQGELIGYKAALTNPKAQEIFNVDQPLLGILLENMLLPSGTKVPTRFGAKPMIEGDLIVRVASDKINDAMTSEETLQYLDAVIPFLELPDLVYDKNIKVDGEMLTAINAGARLGVVGNIIPLDAKKINTKQLQNISVILRDESGEIIVQGNSNALLGDPLNVVFWIKEKLKSQGKTLKKGDLLSLGSITPLVPIQTEKGTKITAEYQGLPTDKIEKVVVTFEYSPITYPH